MEPISTYLMARPRRIKGFTLLECLLVLFLISVLTLLALPTARRFRTVTTVAQVVDEITAAQFAAIRDSQPVIYENQQENLQLHFNRRGNARKANTLIICHDRVIISLGTGRLYVKY